jgi:hypothetical protein
MANTPERVAAITVVPEELLESDQASLITGMTIARAWRDPVFRGRLLAEPREVLTEMGLLLPDGVGIRVFADTPEVRHVVLTAFTSEPEELAPLFRELLPIKEGSEVRLIQHTEQALCLVVPLAPAEPEVLTDADKLRRLAPRASIWAVNENIVENVGMAFAAADGAVGLIELELATATTTFFTWTQVAQHSTFVSNEAEAAETTTTAAAEQTTIAVTTEAEAVETSTTVVAEAEVAAVEAEAAATTTTAAAEAEVATVEAEAAATTTTVVAEAEAVAIAAIVLT